MLVFGGTFLVNYLHTGKGAAKVMAPQEKLTFADLGNQLSRTSRSGRLRRRSGRQSPTNSGSRTTTPKPLPVGVFSETCQCTHVWLYIAPADRKDIPAAADREKAMKELEALTQPTELKDKDHGDTAVSVPAGAVGVLRLEWKGDRAGAERPGRGAVDGREGRRPAATLPDSDGVHRAAANRAGGIDFGDSPRRNCPL